MEMEDNVAFFTKRHPLASSNPLDPSQQSSNELPKSKFELADCAKPLIFLARLTGLIPCGRGSYQTYKQLGLRLSVVPLACSICAACWTINNMISVVTALAWNYAGHMAPLDRLLMATGHVATGTFLTFAYIYFIKNSSKLFQLLESWSRVVASYNLRQDHKPLRSLVFLVIVLTVGPVLVVQLLFITDKHVVRLDGQESNKKRSHSEFYYDIFMRTWKLANIPLNPNLVVAHYIISVYIKLSRVLVAGLLMVCARAASFQFKSLIEDAVEDGGHDDVVNLTLSKKDKAFWISLNSKYRAVCFLVRKLNQLLSPLTFLYVTCFGYYVCLEMFKALRGHRDIPISPFIFWISFILEGFWLFVILYTAAEVNEDAMRIILRVIQHCPKEHYESAAEVFRLEYKVSSGRHIIGFTGLSYFMLTKRFMLKALNAIFTIEIILLQSVGLSGFGGGVVVANNGTNSSSHTFNN